MYLSLVILQDTGLYVRVELLYVTVGRVIHAIKGREIVLY